MSRVPVRAAIAFCVVALVAGCAERVEDATTVAAPVPGASHPERPQAPPIEGVTIDGQHASLEELRGRPVFLNVWSSW